MFLGNEATSVRMIRTQYYVREGTGPMDTCTVHTTLFTWFVIPKLHQLSIYYSFISCIIMVM